MYVATRRRNLRGLGAGTYVGTNFGTNECPAGWTRTNPGQWPVYCLQNPQSSYPAATSAPTTVSTTVNPNIITQVSPNISPVFQQQWQPSNSPASAGTSQQVPSLPAVTSGANAPAAAVDYSRLFEALANQPAQSSITASLPSGGGTTVVERMPDLGLPAGTLPASMLPPAAESPAASIMPIALIGGGAVLLLLMLRKKRK